MNHIKNAKRIAKLLDSQFSILGFKFGIEPIVGLIPFVGDNITLIMSLYIVFAGISMKLPSKIIFQMIVNVAIDYILGLIPLFGDLTDFVFKANDRNMKILDKYSHFQEGEIIEE